MIDQLRSDIEARLAELLAEADKLRGALVALGGANGAAPGGSPERSRYRSVTASQAARARDAASRQGSASWRRGRGRARPATSSPLRSSQGATKSAVLEALAGGDAMTAGEVAAVTGLGRASVSTTLSKLAKSGEVRKAARGYSRAR